MKQELSVEERFIEVAAVADQNSWLKRFLVGVMNKYETQNPRKMAKLIRETRAVFDKLPAGKPSDLTYLIDHVGEAMPFVMSELESFDNASFRVLFEDIPCERTMTDFCGWLFDALMLSTYIRMFNEHASEIRWLPEARLNQLG